MLGTGQKLRSHIGAKDSFRWMELHFTDLAGYLRAVTVPYEEAAKGEPLPLLDGSSVKGFAGIEESDLALLPDMSTTARLPWRKYTARAISDIYKQDRRFERDPRAAAQKAEQVLSAYGYSALVGVEVEFMLVDSITIDVHNPLQGLCYKVVSSELPMEGSQGLQRIKDAYFMPQPIDRVGHVRNEIAETLEDSFGIKVEAHHHEVAALGQVEIDFEAGTLTLTADRVVTIKYVARNIAALQGMTALFMPKPVAADNGNGMHVHVSLWRGSHNAFYDESDEYAGLSQEARYFIGGLLEHARSLAAIVAPTVNSYRRLVPGYEAPVYIVWGKSNRSAVIRVPAYTQPSPRSVRIEFRAPDPSSNPYLALAAIVAAGLDGIKKKIDPGDPLDRNAYSLDPAVRRKMGIRELPRTLEEALDELESDNEYLQHVFSRELLEAYIDIKRHEARRLAGYPSPVEVYEYAGL